MVVLMAWGYLVYLECSLPLEKKKYIYILNGRDRDPDKNRNHNGSVKTLSRCSLCCGLGVPCNLSGKGSQKILCRWVGYGMHFKPLGVFAFAIGWSTGGEDLLRGVGRCSKRLTAGCEGKQRKDTRQNNEAPPTPSQRNKWALPRSLIYKPTKVFHTQRTMQGRKLIARPRFRLSQFFKLRTSLHRCKKVNR